MKPKILFGIAMASLILVSCSETEMHDTQSLPETVGFSTFVGRATRGSVTNLTALQGTGFNVLAYSTTNDWATDEGSATPDFMYNQEVTWDASKWTYSPVKFWPENGNVTFFAYSPATANVALSGEIVTGAPSITYTCPDAAEDQVDLLAARALDQSSSSGDVAFNFGHILMKIGFTGQLNAQYDATEIRITSLKVFYDGSGGGVVKRNGVFNTSDATWSDPAVLSYMTQQPEADADDVIISGGVVLDNSVTPNATILNASDKFLMLIPQELEAQDLYVLIKYTVDGGSEVTAGPVFLPALPIDPTFAPPINVANRNDLISKQYTYNLVLTPEGGVTFSNSIAVGDWQDAATNPADVDI